MTTCRARCVWIDRLKFRIVALHIVLIGIILEAAIATVVAALFVTRDKLLLGEGEELTGGDEVGALKRASRREGPAGSAATLVLDWGDSACLNPVDGVSV